MDLTQLNDEEGNHVLEKTIETMKAKAEQRGRTEGRTEALKETAARLLAQGMPREEGARLVNLLGYSPKVGQFSGIFKLCPRSVAVVTGVSTTPVLRGRRPTELWNLGPGLEPLLRVGRLVRFDYSIYSTFLSSSGRKKRRRRLVS